MSDNSNDKLVLLHEGFDHINPESLSVLASCPTITYGWQKLSVVISENGDMTVLSKPIDPNELYQQVPMGRSSGRTSQQMLQAPRGAYFIWPVGRSLGYAILLAEHLSRKDLKLISLETAARRELGRGTRDPIVIDHACDGYASQSVELSFYIQRLYERLDRLKQKP